jgi:hypothetical protein
MAQPGIARTDRSKNAGGAIAILNAGFVNDESDQVALGVGDDVALTALDSLTRIKARGPTLSVVFTDWLSITSAVGLASRPAASPMP